MKKRILAIIIAILFVLGIGKEIFAEDSSTTYTVAVYDDYKNSNYFYSGYVVYASYNIEGASFIELSGNVSRDNIMIVLTSDYVDLNDDRYYNPYAQPFDTYDEMYISQSFDLTLTNYSSYKYLYFAEYVEILNDDEGINGSSIILSFTLTSFNIELIYDKFIVEYNDTVTAYGNLYDVSDTSIFKVKSVNKYYIEVVSDEYTSSYLKKGSYNVLYRIYDKAGNEMYLPLTINVEYDEALSPTFIDNGIPDEVDITSPVSLDTIKSYLNAIDKTDGNVTDNITFNTNYDEEALEIGAYSIEAYVINSSGYGSYYKKEIVVSDLSAPTISKTSITSSYKTKLSVDDVIEMISPTDYTSYSYEVVADTYTTNYQSIGEYYMNIKLTDSYGNTNTYKIIISSVDDIAPTVLVQNINTTTSDLLTDDEIIASIIVSDKTKCSVSLDRADYDNGYTEVGSYKIYVTVTDSSGNSTTSAITINVIADSYIKYYNNTIQIYNDHSLTEEELITFLRSITDYTYDESSTSTIESNYFKTPYEVGVYDVNLTTTDSSGHEYLENYKISVLEYEVIEEDSNGFSDRLGAFFKSILNAIMALFIFLFHFLF